MKKAVPVKVEKSKKKVKIREPSPEEEDQVICTKVSMPLLQRKPLTPAIRSKSKAIKRE
jgi:hypothetical protein